jgi:hypothetical protein
MIIPCDIRKIKMNTCNDNSMWQKENKNEHMN